MTQSDPAVVVALGRQHLQRWKTLISEHERLLQALPCPADSKVSSRAEIWPGFGPTISRLKGEASLCANSVSKAESFVLGETAADSQLQDELARIGAKLACSNLSAYETQWTATKKCSGIAAIQRYFSTVQTSKSTAAVDKSQSVLVTAVVDGGATWLRVFSVTADRLAAQMAADGWAFGEEVSDEENAAPDDDPDSEETAVHLVKITRDMVKAARIHRHDYTCPRIHLVLNRLEEHHNDDIDVLLRRLRKIGGEDVSVEISCSETDFCTRQAPPIEEAMAKLVSRQDPIELLTRTINVDTSILVALCSDMTYSRVELEPWHGPSLTKEINEENEAPGAVLRGICDLLADRDLVCAREAASALGKLTAKIGQTTEKERASLLLSEDTKPVNDDEALLRSSRLQELSTHEVPSSLRLPVRIADSSWNTTEALATAVESGVLPRVAEAVIPQMVKPTGPVFAHGWAAGVTTVTTNAAGARQIRHLIEEHRTSLDERGPRVHVFTTARSLNSTRKLP